MDNSNEENSLFSGLFRSGSGEESRPISLKGPSSAADLDVRFAENFTATGGKFIYCDSEKNFVDLLLSLKEQESWNHIFIWDEKLRMYLKNLGLEQVENEFFMDNSDAALSACFALLADEGVVLLTSDQATNRRLTSFPPQHLIFASKNNLVSHLEKGLDLFKEQFFDKLPSLIELNPERNICKANHARVLNAQGTPNVYVFYIDIPELG